MTTLYEKRGNRYVPARESLAWDAYSEGDYLVRIRPGQASLCRLAESDHVGFEAAARTALDAMTAALREASDARPAREVTPRQAKALEAYRAVLGDETMWLTLESSYGVAEAGIRAVRDEYRRRRHDPDTRNLRASRIADVLGVLCGKRPPDRLVRAWIDSTSEELQAWVANHLKPGWAMGIAAIEAAEIMAEEPRPETEGTFL